jgi:hypothetical protein
MLETLREFGAEHLSARGELAAIEEAHARHFTTLAWEAEQNLRGPAEPEWVTVLEAELSNFRAAHAWAMRSGNRGVAAELSAALFWFGHWRMHTEVLTWADQLADGPSADMGPHRSRVVAAAGDGAWRRGDLSRARALGDRSVAVAEGSTDARYGWHVLSAVAMFEGRLEDSAAASQQVAELARRDGDHFHAVVGLGNLAVARGYSGDTSTAVETARASRDEAERSGSPSALAWSAYASGEVIAATNPKDALTFLDRAVELADTVEAHFIRGVALLSATSLRARHGDPSIASHALVRIIDHWEQAGNWRQQWVTLRSAVELLARLGNDEAAATVLGAIDAHDAANIYGADAERLSVLQAELGTRLGPLADERLAEGHAISPADVVAFTRRQLGA